MATQKLFLYDGQETGETPKKLGSSLTTRYTWDGKRLTVYWKRGNPQVFQAHTGYAFAIKCDGKPPVVNRLSLPKDKRKLLCWLAGYYRVNTATSEAEFELLLEQQRRRNAFWAYEEYGPQNSKYAFRYCNRPDCGGYCNVAAYVDSSLPLTGTNVIELLAACWGIHRSPYPAQFVKTVLQTRFNLKEAEISALIS